MNVRILTLAVVIGLVAICSLVAQQGRREVAPATPAGEPLGDVHHHHYYGGGAPAPGYGYAYPQRGFSGGLASGVGDARLSTSEASENYAQTAHMVQENHNYAVNSYYANKETHDQYVASKRKKGPTEEEANKFAAAAAPGRLSNAQFDRTTNVIHWPALLRESEFTDTRQTLDRLFHDRTPGNSGAQSENYAEITQACHAMKEQLGAKLRKENLPPVTFIGCEHFIKSLDYEGRFAVQ